MGCPPLRAKRSHFRSEFLRQSDRGLPPRARALHGLGQLIRKSAPCAVRTDDGMVATPSAIAAPQRVVASNFFKVVLRKRRYSRCKCTDPRRLTALARGTEELLATAPHIY